MALQKFRWPAIGLLSLLVGALLWLTPAEATLGGTIKLVYLHGALVRAAVVLFVIALPLNIVALLSNRAGWAAWGKAFVWAAITLWLVHALISMVTTKATWGVFIAWFEPRTRFTFTLAGVGLAVIIVTRLIDNRRFSAGVFVLLSVVMLWMLPNLGVIHHPLDPVGKSGSETLRLTYGAILILIQLLALLLTTWFKDKFPPETA